MSTAPSTGRLAQQYADLAFMREKMQIIQKQQAMRGIENYYQRVAARVNKPNKTWRQMKGMELAMHEIKHPGNRPFVIGLGYVGGCCCVVVVVGGGFESLSDCALRH